MVRCFYSVIQQAGLQDLWLFRAADMWMLKVMPSPGALWPSNFTLRAHDTE